MKIGLPSLLALIFITLKLTGTIAWSWWWVLAPLWIGAGIGIVSFVAFLVLAAVVTAPWKTSKRASY